MRSKTRLTFLLLICVSCNSSSSDADVHTAFQIAIAPKNNHINPYVSIGSIPLPAGFKRSPIESNSFAGWLQQLKLKKDKTVYLYNGQEKANQGAQFAVLDISTGSRDLQQCADAVMRLRAEYLFAENKFDQIIFTDNEGKRYHFNEPYTASHLHTYLQTVFGMCGSASLAKQLHRVDIKEMQPGDVLIRGGFPGHAVMVMDVAGNESGKKIFLLAQSYMPAQDIHLLINPSDEKLSPWYNIDGAAAIDTPEYVFSKKELKRW